MQPDAAAQRSSAVQSWPLLCARSNGLILPSTEKQRIKLKYCAALKRESRAGRDSRFILSKWRRITQSGKICSFQDANML